MNAKANKQPDPSARQAINRAELDVLSAQPREDSKKQGKEKKPDENLVSLVFPGA